MPGAGNIGEASHSGNSMGLPLLRGRGGTDAHANANAKPGLKVPHLWYMFIGTRTLANKSCIGPFVIYQCFQAKMVFNGCNAVGCRLLLCCLVHSRVAAANRVCLPVGPLQLALGLGPARCRQNLRVSVHAHPLKGVEPELFAPEELLEARGGGGGANPALGAISGATSPAAAEAHGAHASAAAVTGSGGAGGASWFSHWFSGNLRESAHSGAALAQPPHVRPGRPGMHKSELHSHLPMELNKCAVHADERPCALHQHACQLEACTPHAWSAGIRPSQVCMLVPPLSPCGVCARARQPARTPGALRFKPGACACRRCACR